MFQGFYTLTSGVLTQTRNLNVISNNMANATTPGFKSDRFIISEFRDELILRTGNKNKSDRTAIGSKPMITGGADVTTDYTQGPFVNTSSTLDFALAGNGFFCIQTDNGTVYTRDGNFTLDEQGYLYLGTVGRVLGTNGPIYLGTDRIEADRQGRLFTEDGAYLGQLMVVDFQDYGQLNKTAGNVFTTDANAIQANVDIEWGVLENSNADPIDQMTRMMASQRALQSSAQVMKIYDDLTTRLLSRVDPTA